MYDCLIGTGELGASRTDLNDDQMVAMAEKAQYFEIIVSTMPLAQQPHGSLLLLMKTHDRDADPSDMWVRVSLEPKTMTGLVRRLLEARVR